MIATKQHTIDDFIACGRYLVAQKYTSPQHVAPLLNMDAYLHVVDGTKYPAVMLNTGINDPRVSPWELAKFAARLQSASTSGRPILLRVDYDAGHGFLDTSRSQAEGLLADQFSFLLWQLGDPLFASQPQRIIAVKRTTASR